LIEAGVDDTFSTLESAQFRINHACSIRSHSRISRCFVSRTCSSGRAQCAHPVETHDNQPHPSFSSSLCSKSSQAFLSLIWTLISMLYNFSHHYIRPHRPTQCFLSSSSRRFCCLLTFMTNAPLCQQLYCKLEVSCNNKKRFNQSYRSMSFELEISYHLQRWNAQHPGTSTLPSRLARKTSDVIGSVTVP
jgi:hypothetical protein